MPVSLLLVDDDAELCGMMVEFFTSIGHALDCAYNGRDGLARILQGGYDLAILDVMLPIINGFALLAQIRKRSTIPVIVLTTRVQPKDRVEGLNLGADDYLPKPFDPDELLARIRAVLRRTAASSAEPSVRTCGEIVLNSTTREVRRNRMLIDVTALEFDILEMLMRASGRIVPRDEIMLTLFERMPSAYDRSLDVHISHLRKKLERGGALIRSIRGVGYTLVAEPLAGI
jgi:two-component system response regulator CpxR